MKTSVRHVALSACHDVTFMGGKIGIQKQPYYYGCLEPKAGLEPATYSLRMSYSTN